MCLFTLSCSALSSPAGPGQGEGAALLHQPLGAGRSLPPQPRHNSRCFPRQAVTLPCPLLFTRLDPSRANRRSHICEPDLGSRAGQCPSFHPHTALAGDMALQSGSRGCDTPDMQADSSDKIINPLFNTTPMLHNSKEQGRSSKERFHTAKTPLRLSREK